MRRLLLALALLVAACTAESTATTPPPDPSPVIPVATEAPPATQPRERCFPDDAGPDAYVARGVVGTAGGPGGDARVVSEIRLGSPRRAPGDEPARCERLVVDLATTEGAPATAVGLAGVELLADRGILRISLPQVVTQTATADSLLEGHLVDRVFVIADTEGRLTVDAHLRAAVAAAVAPTGRGSVTVDLRREAEGPPVPPAARPGVVLLAPEQVDAAYPLTVGGYGRSATGRLAVRLIGSDDVVETEVAVPDHPWGWFELVIPAGPTGIVGLEVGGLELPLRVG